MLFNNVRAEMRERRASYGFLILLTVVCAILGVSTTHYRDEAKRYELEDCYESLTLCADALGAWEYADSDEERATAAMRFETAVAALPSEVGTVPLFALADNMRLGESAAERVRTLYDTFALLSSIEYSNENEARRIIASTLDGVNGELVISPPPIAARTSESIAEIRPEVLEYSRKNAVRSIRSLLGGSASTFEIALSDEGDAWVAENENLRMSFSTNDGSLDGFVYIRLGDTPEGTVGREEQLSRALGFFRKMRRSSSGADIAAVGELCGFLLAEISDDGEIWQSCVDSHGRVWSLMKVKR